MGVGGGLGGDGETIGDGMVSVCGDVCGGVCGVEKIDGGDVG